MRESITPFEAHKLARRAHDLDQIALPLESKTHYLLWDDALICG